MILSTVEFRTPYGTCLQCICSKNTLNVLCYRHKKKCLYVTFYLTKNLVFDSQGHACLGPRKYTFLCVCRPVVLNPNVGV